MHLKAHKQTNTRCCDVLFDHNDCACVMCVLCCVVKKDDKRTKQKQKRKNNKWNWTEELHMLPLNRYIWLKSRYLRHEIWCVRQCIMGVHMLIRMCVFVCHMNTDRINSLSHFINALKLRYFFFLYNESAGHAPSRTHTHTFHSFRLCVTSFGNWVRLSLVAVFVELKIQCETP